MTSHILKDSSRERSYFPPRDQFLPEHQDAFDENGDPVAIRARYDAQIVAHERTGKKLEDAEKVLDKEREKSSQLREDLVKGIEVEKMKKERLQEDMAKMRENFAKEELRYSKLIQDLDLKVLGLENERLALLVHWV